MSPRPEPQPEAAPTRREPPVSPESAPFWEATRRGVFLLQWCDACNRPVFYPRVMCPRCSAPAAGMTWRETSGRATVHAAVVEHRPERAGATFAEGRPYCVALVDLEEGVRMMTNVVGCAPNDVHEGMPVSLTWEPLSDGRQLPLFQPTSGAGGIATSDDRTTVEGVAR
jgi:uncharacterized protein